MPGPYQFNHGQPMSNSTQRHRAAIRPGVNEWVALDSKLRFDRRLVDHRQDLRNSFVAKPIEDILGKDDPPAVHRKIEEETLGPAVESESARDMGRFAD